MVCHRVLGVVVDDCMFEWVPVGWQSSVVCWDDRRADVGLGSRCSFVVVAKL